eukprot:1191906-Prorocentrum_minimum.AAC.1
MDRRLYLPITYEPKEDHLLPRPLAGAGGKAVGCAVCKGAARGPRTPPRPPASPPQGGGAPAARARTSSCQSYAGSTGIFSRRTNHTREARVYSHDGPIVRGKHGYILTTDPSYAGST